jgi:hypothetical protein
MPSNPPIRARERRCAPQTAEGRFVPENFRLRSEMH